MAFGLKVVYVIWANPSPVHCWEKVGLIEPKITPRSCRKWYCVKCMGHVSWKVLIRLSNILGGVHVVVDGGHGVRIMFWEDLMYLLMSRKTPVAKY